MDERLDPEELDGVGDGGALAFPLSWAFGMGSSGVPILSAARVLGKAGVVLGPVPKRACRAAPLSATCSSSEVRGVSGGVEAGVSTAAASDSTRSLSYSPLS